MTTMPIRNKMKSDEFYKGLDYGIRFPVKVLHAAGIDTFQSCQGGPGHAYDHPSIDLGSSNPSDALGFAALHALEAYDLPVRSVEYIWRIEKGAPVENFWRMTFKEDMAERCLDEPGFIWMYQWNSKCED